VDVLRKLCKTDILTFLLYNFLNGEKMSKIIYVPQFPTKMRYQQWHYSSIKNFFERKFKNVITLGELKQDILSDKTDEMFSPINSAIDFELSQIKQFMDLDTKDIDYLYLNDLSFPGLFSNILHHKKTRKMFAYVHGTSKNKLDYFEMDRESKWLVETGQSKLFDKIFVGSEYHANKLGWKNIEVIGLPIPPYPSFNEKKIFDIISVARPCKQKITRSVEKKVEKIFGKIKRNNNNSWLEYYKFLSQGKILLITGKEDTFNYSILEAILNNTIVLAPNRCSYPELLPKEYIYNTSKELIEKINYYIINYNKVPELKNWNIISNFYNNLQSFIKN
jgi:hypothetical protein